MGKPSAPAPPDYAAAAKEQGVANVNSALATNYLNQANQVTPYGNLTYSYSKPADTGTVDFSGYSYNPQLGYYANGSGQAYTNTALAGKTDANGGHYLPDGTYIPQTTVTTTLSPEQQKLYDQQTSIGTQLNDLAARGIGYVDQASSKPIDQSTLPSLNTGLTLSPDAVALRDKITDAYMQRLQPMLDQQRSAMDTKLANQGITVGSQAWNADQDSFNRGLNDQRMAALLAGDQEQQNQFNRGLASATFGNQARQQAIQEADYFKNQPLNMLNALRSGNQVSMPQFSNWSGGASVQAAPSYQATADSYQAALDKYKTEMSASNALLGGLASIGGSAITKFSDRRLKQGVRRIGQLANGLAVYAYTYIWGGPEQVGVMADEVAKIKPEAIGPTLFGFQTVNYGAL